MEQPTRKWRWGVNRWIVLLLIILSVIAFLKFPAVLPHIQLPAENLSHTPLFGNFYLTNTLVAMLIVDVLLLIIALIVRRAATSGELVPKGFSGAVEALLEVIYNLTEATAGKWGKAIFPFFAAITLLVLVANWMELVPGVDSIGILEEVQPGEQEARPGNRIQEVFPGVYSVVKIGTDEPQAEGEPEGRYMLVPYVRVLSTDLNFTLALALIAVFMVQVFGVRSLGIRYFQKFINVTGIFKRPIFGLMDLFVGLLELISEVSKILSFSFRLFGNIFAGSVLLFVIGFLLPVIFHSVFLGLEFAVGLIQAVVFGMLAMVFMAQATQGHGEHAEEHS